MFDIVFVYLRVIVLVIMSEWMSRLCTFVHVCARLCTNYARHIPSIPR